MTGVGFSILYEAAIIQADFHGVTRLVRDGIIVNVRDSFGRTVLHHAAEWSLKDMIGHLVHLGANVNARDLQRWTPLPYVLTSKATERMVRDIQEHPDFPCNVSVDKDTLASDALLNREAKRMIERRKIELIDLLVKHGASVSVTFDRFVTSLHLAVELENREAVSVLASLGLAVLRLQKLSDVTALHLAMDQHEQIVMDHLIAIGADVNCRCWRSLPIHQAVDSGRVDIIEVLLHFGANFELIRHLEIPTVIYALLYKTWDYEEVLEWLATLGADFNLTCRISDVVFEASRRNDSTMVEYLVTKGKAGYGQGTTVTPIGWAICKLDTEILRCLVKCGADIETRYDFVVSGLAEAVRSGNKDMARLLMSLKASPETCYHPDGITALYQVLELTKVDAAAPVAMDMLKCCLQLGADVNALCDIKSLLHVAVANGDIETVAALGEMDANMRITRKEGVRVFQQPLFLQFPTVKTLQRDLIQVLVEAGADLNARHTLSISAVHDAVMNGRTDIIETLVSCGAELNCGKTENVTALWQAIGLDSHELVQYFVQRGADVNIKARVRTTPLHDAVSRGDTQTIACLMVHGADIVLERRENFCVLGHAIQREDEDMMKCLIEAGANICSLSSNRGVLHDLITFSDPVLTLWVTNHMMTNHYRDVREQRQISLLYDAILSGKLVLVETLLKAGIQVNGPQFLLDNDMAEEMADGLGRQIMLHQGADSEIWIAACVSLIKTCVRKKEQGPSAFEVASAVGEVNIARLLMVTGNKGKCRNRAEESQRYLQVPRYLAYMHDTLTQLNTSAKALEVIQGSVWDLHLACSSMEMLLSSPGVGDVQCLAHPMNTQLLRQVYDLLRSGFNKCEWFCKGKLIPCGSSSEGTKVGLPNEMDFLLAMDLQPFQSAKVRDAGFGHAYFSDVSFPLYSGGSKQFHTSYTIDVTYGKAFVPGSKFGDLSISQGHVDIIRDVNRRATSSLQIKWKDPHSDAIILISVDTVPCLHVRDWPDGGLPKTWLLDGEGLKEHGYYLVAKPPHEKSDLAKMYTDAELQVLWKLSFAPLETYHMQNLPKRIRDAYLAAKCLRDPDVCRIMVKDGDSLPKCIDKYITSYMLKMIFFKHVEYFLGGNMSLEEMVCIVYNDVAQGLADRFIPIFFFPSANALDGHKLDVSKCAKVAQIMKRFVLALHLRDGLGDGTEYDIEEEVVLYQRQPASVYKLLLL